MKDESLPKQLIRLAYTELILQHAEADSPSDFVENLQEDLNQNDINPDTPTELAGTNHLDTNSDLEEAADTKGDSIFSKLSSKFSDNKKLLVASFVILTMILPAIGLLLWSNLHFKDKILPNTNYASMKLSSNPQEAYQQIKDTSASYNIRLEFNENQTSYKPGELGLNIDAAATVDAAKVQSNQVRFFAKPFALFRSRNINTSSTLDQEKLKTFLEAQNYSDKLPEDAKISFNEGSGKFEINSEVAGRGIDSKSLSSKLQLAISDLNPTPIDLKIENVTPSITAEDLKGPKDEANSIISQRISVSTPGKNYAPSSATMKDWVVLTADPGNSSYKISLNEKSQRDYIDSITSKVNRKMEKRLYATIDGSEMLLQEGTSGLQVTNTDMAKTELINIVKAKKGGIISLEAKEESPSTENIAATGGRWIFADLSQFRVYAYEGSSLVNSFAMSSGKASTATPTGRYSVMSKVRVKTMTSGGNKNSKDYYSVPNIEWVAYFKAGGYAMHGVYWHNKFGIENTSHGCMGMSNASAQWVYNFVDIGTPVIIVS